MGTPSKKTNEWEVVSTQVKKCRDFVAGESAVKGEGETYLMKFDPTMMVDRYNLYKEEAQTVGLTSAFHESLLGALTRRQPTITIPTAADWLLDTFGDRGQGLQLWLLEALGSQLTSGNDFVFLDYPSQEAESIRLGIDVKPYPIMIRAEDIIATNVEMVGSAQVLTEFRFSVNELDPSNKLFDDKERTRVVRLFLKDGLAYRQDYVQDKEEGELMEFVLKGKRLDVLPVFSWSGQMKPVTPLLLAMADLDQHSYNQQSRSNHYSLLMGTSTLVVTGVTGDEADSFQGLGGIFTTESEQAKFSMLGLDPSIVAAYETKLATNRLTAAALGARMFAQESKQAETAEALSIKNAGSHATLGQLATTFGKVLQEILAFTIYWDTGVMPTPVDVAVEFSKDFIPAVLNGTDLTALVGARLQGAITDRVFYEALVKGELIAEDYLFEEFVEDRQAQLAVEQPAVEGDLGDE